MAGDMYLENLEEFIFDEDRVVTYRWLSQTLSVHVNQAKQMLETFVERQKGISNSKTVNVTYLLSGTQEKDNGVKVNKVTLVSDQNLEKTEAAMTHVISKHVYSVQKAKLKDSNSLYMTDYQIIKDNIRQPNRFSAIRCVEAKPRTSEELAELSELSAQSRSNPASATNTPSKPKMNGSTTKQVIENLKQEPQKKVAAKPQKGQITSFAAFAGTTNTGSSDKSEEKATEDSTTQKKDQRKKQGPSSKAKGGMMAFLNRPSTTKTKKEETLPATEPICKEPEVKTTQVQEKSIVDPKKTNVEQNKPIVESKKDLHAGVKAKRKAAKIDVSNSDSEEDSSHRQSNKRRRRIIQQVSSSSNESEDEQSDMEDSPIPPTPPPPPMETNSSDEEVEKVTKKSSHAPRTRGREQSPTTSSNRKKRGRKRVLRNKTTIDEDGCMVTEKVWESDSTDDEDIAPPTKTSQPSSLPSQAPPKVGRAKTDGGIEDNTKTSPGSGSGSGKAKQRSLMSFFKKK